jgi:pimeloyl-ACP methyl ester carboxylesterase
MQRLLVSAVWIATAAAAPPYSPSQSELHQIRLQMAELDNRLAKLAGNPLLADVAVYGKAANWILRHPDEFFSADYVANTLAALQRGLSRAEQLLSGNPAWPEQKGRLARGYRSRVDGSYQPYGLIIPDSYAGRPVRLDVWLHGRGATLNEVSFLAAHDSPKPAPADQDFIQLDVFGRTNNAYRWAGETDVFEAVESVRERYRIDPERIVLRGFSMGGAGGWHLGLHHPDRWAAVEAGAGFTETRRYAKQTSLPPHQEKSLRIYDAVDYALNAFNVPVVGYGGDEDPQLQASVNIRERLAAEGFSSTRQGLTWITEGLRAIFLVGPKTGHRFHPESKAESEQFIRKILAAGRREPDRIRFVTYTPRYNRCFWIEVDALERLYERAEVDARRDSGGIHVTTKNVARLVVRGAGPVTIDGSRFRAGSRAFVRDNGKWADRDSPGLRKNHGLQGPIDDAFMEPFLCVRPTGVSPNPAVSDHARAALERFGRDFAKWLRADASTKSDQEVTPEDIQSRNLILFGDPWSNRVLARIIKKLPIAWTRTEVVVAGKHFDAVSHVPVLIYPNPLNPRRYVVLNTGHTFGEAEFRGTNALLFPRSGDYAVIEAGSGKVALAGLFNERWQF